MVVEVKKKKNIVKQKRGKLNHCLCLLDILDHDYVYTHADKIHQDSQKKERKKVKSITLSFFNDYVSKASTQKSFISIFLSYYFFLKISANEKREEN